MKKLMCILTMLCLLAMPAALAEGETSIAQATLTVTGTAEVVLAADSAVMSLGVSTQAATVAEANTANAAALDAVINALHNANVDAADIVTQEYSVSPVYQYTYGKIEKGESISGYQVTNQLTVTVRDVEQIGTVLDAAVSAGANQVYGITFQASQAADARDQALTAAVAEGMRKAKLLAKASGKQLGELVSVQEEPYSTASGVTMKYEAADAAAGTTILADSLTVSAQVTLTYAVK